MKTRLITFLSALISLQCYAAAPSSAELEVAPEGFTSICTLDENCAVEDSVIVAFGRGSQFVYKTLSGAFLCNPDTFSAPEEYSGISPHCSIIDAQSPSSQAQSSTSSDSDLKVAQGNYALISRYSGKALSVFASSKEDGADVVQQDFSQQQHQIWHITPLENGYYSIIASHSDKSLENLDWDSKDGGDLQQLPWMNSWSQHWEIQETDQGYVKVLSRTNGQALDVYALNNKNDGNVVMWTFWGGENQHWRLVPIVSE